MPIEIVHSIPYLKAIVMFTLSDSNYKVIVALQNVVYDHDLDF